MKLFGQLLPLPIVKIKSPQQITLLITIVVTILTGLIYVALAALGQTKMELKFLLIMMVLICGATYLSTYYLLKALIVTRIKTLYRTLSSQKISKNDFQVEMDSDVLGNAQSEVNNWVVDKSKEIETLKSQEAFRREFIGNLAHELRTPTFSIQGYILTLLEGGMEDENINRKFLERAAKGVDRMASIIEDLGEITNLEAENIKLNIKRVDILEYGREVLDSFEIKAKKRNISLSVENRMGGPIHVECDQHKIGQVMTNLINNALVYGNEGGYVKLRFFDYDDRVLVEVADDGPGIKKEYLNRLFERFYRVEKSRSRNNGGSGLGLSIAKHIVEAHGQLINVRSTEGKGSTFSFTLQKAKKL